MSNEQVIETFDGPGAMTGRVKQSVATGMVQVLNVGFHKGHRILYPQHMMVVTMPEPGATLSVPVETARYLVMMFPKKIQYTHGQLPSNFTPPPGYKLVPVTPADVEVTEEELLMKES